MRSPTTYAHRILALVAAIVASGCSDTPTRIVQPHTANLSAVKFWDANASTRWNERAIAHMNQRTLANGQAAASRILTYLSLAQYRAVLAAEAGKDGPVHPAVSVAVGAASAAVLSWFFPVDAATFEAQLDADLAATGWPGAKNQDAASGEAIGRAVGAAVIAQASTDNYLPGVSVGVPPVGPGFWVWNGLPIVRSIHGVRPFFMTSASQLRSPPPPPFGSTAFLAALAEIRAISDNRTAEQLAAAQFWAAGFTISSNNKEANALIRKYHRTEREAARILAYANAAAFDAQIACWDTKVFYWFIRPSQADPGITVPISLPNHPSYPSGHSCITGAVMTVLMDAFPGERDRLAAIVEEAGVSRMYGGIHYRFDIEAGQTIGRGAAALALAGALE
ncbi:MAG TPA: vanadium-dependent haloperoxidase [Gemmatimonadaceae bacterium]|nr:vanadium-dependent haloperoxidase [Gemmatimonadaceae bacterium]